MQRSEAKNLLPYPTTVILSEAKNLPDPIDSLHPSDAVTLRLCG
jgi:hypothetical protein